MASSAVNFPIIRARLRLVVIWTGGSILCTKAGARLPRLIFTTNLTFFKVFSYSLGTRNWCAPRQVFHSFLKRYCFAFIQLCALSAIFNLRLNVFVSFIRIFIRRRFFAVRLIGRLRPHGHLGIWHIRDPWDGWLLARSESGGGPGCGSRGSGALPVYPID